MKTAHVALPLFLLCASLQSQTAKAQAYSMESLTPDRLDAMVSNSLLFDLNLIRLKPTTLDDGAWMRYFVLMNNCSAPSAEQLRLVKALDNELDAPKLAAYYKARAKSIVDSTPRSITISMNQRLGQYDPAKQAFAFFNNEKISISSLTTPVNRGKITKLCSAATWPAILSGSLPNSYLAIFKGPLIFENLPAGEPIARKVIDGARSGDRRVYLNIEMHIVDIPPEFRNMGAGIVATFAVDVDKVTASDANTGQNLGVLYDARSHSSTSAP